MPVCLQSNAKHSRKTKSPSPLRDNEGPQLLTEINDTYENNESQGRPVVPSTPSSSQGVEQRTESRAMGSSPWVSANLSIFSPTAMASSPVRPSPVRWRIASPLPEVQALEIAEIATPVDVVNEPEISQTDVAEDVAMSRESTPKRANEVAKQAGPTSPTQQVSARAETTSPMQHSSDREEPQFQDEAVDYMPETDFRAFEREDSPMSSHNGETGEDDVVGEQEDVLHEEEQEDSPEASSDELAEEPGIQPNTDHETKAIEPLVSLEQTDPASESQGSCAPATQDPILLDQPSMPTKKRVGRICLRLPLNPTRIKLEPEDEPDATAGRGTEISTTTETEDSAIAAAQVSEATPNEEQPLPSSDEGCSDHETESPALEEQSLVSVTSNVPPEGSIESEYGGTEKQDSEIQVAAEAIDAVTEVSRRIVEKPMTIAIKKTPAARAMLAPQSSMMARADSPFQMRDITKATVSPSHLATRGETSSKRLFKESVSSISVTSEDPRAAARAAALLKLVCNS